MTPTPVVLSWSGGKDSALALAALAAAPEWNVVALLTTVTADYDRVSMHGVRRELLKAQAASLGVPLIEAPIPAGASNAVYEAAMGAAFERLRHGSSGCDIESYCASECDRVSERDCDSRRPTAAGSSRRSAITNAPDDENSHSRRSLSSAEAARTIEPVRHIAFGDLFLADIRTYREQLVGRHGMEAVFPVWGRDTRILAMEFIERGFAARLVCIDPRAIDESFAGRQFDDALLADLPPQVDPCGENGEFHTFVWDGPIFTRPVRVAAGEIVRRDSFVFADLVLSHKDDRRPASRSGAPALSESR